MICTPCKEAGQCVSAAWRPTGNVFLFLLKEAEQRHAKCPAIVVGQPTLCDCQHKTDQSYINQEAKSVLP